MHSHQFEWLVSPEGLFWHSEATVRALSLPRLQFIWTPSSVEQLFSLEPVAGGETDGSTPITCTCPRGLTLSRSPQSRRVTTLERKTKKHHQKALLLTVVLCSSSESTSAVCHIQQCTSRGGACCVSEKAMTSASSHVVLVSPLQGK